MRPLELTIEGFTSFRNKQYIDFSQLELFAITGKTGAGKSSLLDAMTLALYGRVARFDGKTSAKDLLSQGSTKLQVTLRFLANGTEYQVSRSWLYRTKTAQPTFKLDKRVNGAWEAEGEQKEADITASIEQILGMNYETFTKVILLPQGKFDEFLKGKGAERRKILRELAGYTIFERMREQAEKQSNLITGECKSLQNRLDNWDLPSAEELNQKCDRYTILEQELPRLHQAFDGARNTIAAEKQLFDRLQHLATLQQELDTLNQEATQIIALKQQLEQARVCDRLSATWTKVHSIRQRYQKAQYNAEAATHNLTQTQAALQIQAQQLQEAQAYKVEIEPQLQRREQALNSTKIYDEQRTQVSDEVKRLEKILAEKTKAIADTEKTVKSVENELSAKQQQVIKVNKEIAQYSPGGDRLERLNRVAPLLIQSEGIHKQVESDRTKLQHLNLELQKAEQDRQTAVESYQQAEAEFLSFRTEFTSARQQDHAATLRMLLHTGDNCPVCGGVYPEAHLLPLATSFDIKTLEKRDRTAESKRQTAAANKTKAETTQESLKQQVDDAQRSLTTIQDELIAITQHISNILSTQKWELNPLKLEHKALQENDAKYQEILRIKEKIEAEVQNSELNFDFAQKRLIEVRSQHQDAVTEVERQKTKLQEIVAKLTDIAGGQSYDTLLQQLERDKRNLAEKIEQANQSYQAVRDKFIQTSQEETKAREDFTDATTEKAQVEAEWQTRLLAEKLTEEIFLKSQISPESQNKLQEKIETYEQKKIQLETLVQQETKELGGKTTNAEIIAKLETAVNAADANRKSSQDEYEQLKVWIAKAEDNRQQAKKLQSDLSQKQQELETYRTLAKELKSDRFQAYILQHFEHELVAQATVLLRELTEQRYALKYDDKEYYVEDRWSGGEARRVQTLSGGETFATSLSLALALSEKLSGGAKLGSLFIDEGFGTLDAETLESVCNILQSLGQQDRLVGVITHVPALGEQLGTQIKIEKLPEGSQIIKP